MERASYFLILLVVLITSVYPDEPDNIFYKTYINNDVGRWKYYIDSLDTLSPQSNEDQLRLLNYYYGYIAYCIGVLKNKKEAEQYLKQAEMYVEAFEKQQLYPSFVAAYRSAFSGFKIGINMLNAPVLGKDGFTYARRAIQLDSLNPFGYVQYANALYYSPSLFGGSKTAALDNYLKAIELFELSNTTTENWNYLNTLALAGKLAYELEQYDKACMLYKKALRAEPEFLWVKKELLPLLQKKASLCYE